MDSYYENTENLNVEECEDPHCHGCQKPIEDGSVVQFGEDGSPICEDCSYSCHACLKTIKDEAIMTGDEAYHADCFRCVQCSKKIDDLVFTQTSKGTDTRLESNDISELNDMLMGQRNSEETIRNSVDIVPRLDLDQSDDPKVRELKKELNETKARLSETISRRALDEFRMVKDSYASEVTSRREAENLTIRLKSEITFYQQASIFSGHDFIHYSKEEIEELNKARAELEQVCHALRLERNELVNELEHHSDNIEKLLSSQKPQDLHWERLQHAYQQQLDSMQKDMTLAKSSYAKLIKGREDIISDMILLNTKNAELTQLNNDLSRRVMEKEQEAKAVFAGMSFLTAPEEKVTSSSSSTSSSTNKHRRNLSTGSIGITPSSSMPDIKSQTDQHPKIAQRDSFNGSAAPKLFKFRRNRSGSGKKSSNKISEEKMISIPYESKNLEPVSETFVKKEQEPTNISTRKHHFAQTKFIRPVKCEACSEKMWRVSELKCADCGMVCHSKCVYSAPQACIRKSTDANRPDGLMFGNDLIKQIQYEKSKVPLIVEKCIESVETRGMDYEGIYRKSGGVGQMRQIQQAFEKGELPNLNDEEKWNDICAVTSVLKQYFRELPNPLFTYELHSKFIDSMMISNSAEQLQAVTQLIQTLPIENFNTLKYLMDHLYRIQQRNKENLMTSKNIAVIFGPTLLRDQDENRDLLEMNHKFGMIEYILNHMDTLFVIETINGKSNGGVDHRRMHLPPLQPGEDLSSILGTYQLRANEETSSNAAVPPRQNAGYI
ncbi:hypothetical protein HPULCUR_012041 [Helicostylum pulchrum]|uniref:RhoGAP-domain-containing protein n=1 Tax=Helicostylum pulchrum TaxID=562976 RepID=A0ABP9YI25_9FUNG